MNCLLQLLLSCVGLSYNQDEHFKFIVHENQYLSLKPFYDCRSGYTDCPNYRPQTKFAKVMFLHLSVSHSVHGGGCLPQCMLGYTHPLGTDTPPRIRHPPGSRHPPCAVHAGRYGQQSDGTHPTGMQTCIENIFTPRY